MSAVYCWNDTAKISMSPTHSDDMHDMQAAGTSKDEYRHHSKVVAGRLATTQGPQSDKVSISRGEDLCDWRGSLLEALPKVLGHRGSGGRLGTATTTVAMFEHCGCWLG